ncbi:MAG: CCA tRNA nucleotidyltransferase, partial [Chlamydiota bacterium]
HIERIGKLAPHTERAKTKKLLVSGKLLLDMGFKPGEQMGDLIDEAERIAVFLDLDTTESVLKRLKETELWKELAP